MGSFGLSSSEMSVEEAGASPFKNGKQLTTGETERRSKGTKAKWRPAERGTVLPALLICLLMMKSTDIEASLSEQLKQLTTPEPSRR